MRSQIYSWLSLDAPLALLVEDRIYPVNMEDVKPPRPYLVYGMGVTTPRVVPAKTEIVQFWAHDDRGDYMVIDAILARVKEILTSQAHFGEFYQAHWLDDSPDLYDDASATITKYTRFHVIQKVNHA